MIYTWIEPLILLSLTMFVPPPSLSFPNLDLCHRIRNILWLINYLNIEPMPASIPFLLPPIRLTTDPKSHGVISTDNRADSYPYRGNSRENTESIPNILLMYQSSPPSILAALSLGLYLRHSLFPFSPSNLIQFVLAPAIHIFQTAKHAISQLIFI